MSYIKSTEDINILRYRLFKMVITLIGISFGSLLLQLYNSAYLPSSKEIVLVPNGLKENVELGKGKYSEHYLKELTKSFTNLLVNKDYINIEKNNYKLLSVVDYDMQEYIRFKLKQEVGTYKNDELSTKLIKIDGLNVDLQLLQGKADGMRIVYSKGVPIREEKVRIIISFKDIGNLLVVKDFNIFTEEMKLLVNEGNIFKKN